MVARHPSWNQNHHTRPRLLLPLLDAWKRKQKQKISKSSVRKREKEYNVNVAVGYCICFFYSWSSNQKMTMMMMTKMLPLIRTNDIAWWPRMPCSAGKQLVQVVEGRAQCTRTVRGSKRETRTRSRPKKQQWTLSAYTIIPGTRMEEKIK